MRRYRLNVALLLAGLVAAVGIAVWLFLSGFWPQGCLAVIAGFVCILALWNLQTRLIHTMSAFVSALEMNDTTLRVEAGGDNELRRMSQAMNRISELYHNNLRELETRKLYYDRILKIMTHEMRNGITPLIAITTDMESDPERYQGDTLVEASSLLRTQAEGIKRFLDSYYSLTHLPEPKIENVRAGDYFTGVKRLVGSELQQRGLPDGVVSFTVPEDMVLQIDASLITQVLINLIRNALDAIESPNGLDPVESREDGRVEVVLTISDSRPYLIVTDNGSGMSPEVMANLFQPFFTTKEGGSGVGLSLCRQIVRRHGGDLRIQSQPGKGTVVSVNLY